MTLTELYVELGRQITGPRTASEKLSGVIQLAVAHVAGAEWSSIVRGRPGALSTVASTDDRATVVDMIQSDAVTGPCVDALSFGRSEAVDVGTDVRWPELSRMVAEHSPLRSVLSFRLFTEDDKFSAVLNLYSTQPAAFGPNAAAAAMLVATCAASVFDSAGAQENARQLRHAVDSNRDIGAAVGVLMAQHKVGRDQAFGLLRLASQHSNRKLVAIAAEVVETGTLDLSAGRSEALRRLAELQTGSGLAEMSKGQLPAGSGPGTGRGPYSGAGGAQAPTDSERLHRLQGLIAALSGTITVTDVADVLWREGPLVAGVVATGLAIVDPVGRRIHFVPSTGHLHTEPVRWTSIAITDDQPVAEAARTTSPLYFSQPHALLTRYPDLQGAQAATGDRSWAILPLTGHDTPPGVLTLAWPEPRDFTPADKAFIAAVGQLCSSALSRALLREERNLATNLSRSADSATASADS